MSIKALVFSNRKRYRHDGLAYKPLWVFAHTMRGDEGVPLQIDPSASWVDLGVKGWEKGLAWLFHPHIRGRWWYDYIVFFLPCVTTTFFFLPEAVIPKLACNYNGQKQTRFLGKKNSNYTFTLLCQNSWGPDWMGCPFFPSGKNGINYDAQNIS